MPTSNPRVNVTFSENDAEMMQLICKKKKMSMSGLVRKVMEDWLEEHEEEGERLKKGGRKTIQHEELWQQVQEICQLTHKKRGTVIKEALNLYLQQQKRSWPESVMSFQGIEIPAFEAYRNEFKPESRQPFLE